MRHRPRKMWLGRFYWRTVKRWPAIYVLCCCVGLAVGVESLFLFGTSEPDIVKRIFLRALGVLMLVCYGWFIVAFLVRCKRGTWRPHCESRISFFAGVDD